MRAWRETTALC